MLAHRAPALLRYRPALRAVASLGLALLIAAGCGGAPPHRAASTRRPPVAKTPAAPARAPAADPMLPAQILAHLDSEDTAPYFARRGDEALLLYAAGGRWRTVVVDPDGAPKGEAADLGPAPADVPVGVLRAVASGYLAAWVENVQGNHAVRALSLDAAGKAAAPPRLLQQSADEVAWLDVLPNEKGAVIVWEMPRDDRADLLAVAVAGDAPAGDRARPALVARDVLGWQAAATARGAAIAIVTPPPAAGAGRRRVAQDAADAADAKLGAVALIEIDAAGKAAPPVTVSADPTAEMDVEIASVGGRYLIAWTDARDIDGSVYLAVAEPGGKLSVPPRRATPPSGEQALVSLVAAPYAPGGGAAPRALLAWEDLLRAPRDGRLIHLATVGPDGALGKDRAALVFSASGPPDLVADGDGFAAVTLAPASRASADPAADAPIWPTYVRFGPDLTLRAAEPVRAAPFAATDGVPYLVRALSCHAGACTTLATAAAGEVTAPAPGAAAGAAPPTTPLALVSLPVRPSAWRAPALREDQDTPPRAAAIKAIYDGDHLARVTAADIEGGSLAAWVTYHLDGASDNAQRGKDLGATLAVRALGKSSANVGNISVISQKASSLGGVSLAVAPPERPGAAGASGQAEAALAWVAREKGETQVYVTKLGPAGDKRAQKRVTTISRRKKGAPPSEASDAAVAWDGEGWTVAWVDTRDGNAEVYVARVDRSLRKTVPDRRVTDAAGDAAEVQVAVRGKEIWIAWSDSRQAGDDGGAEIYLARLDGKTLQKLAPETRLFASPEHSRTPSLAPFGGGVVAAWIEEPLERAAATDAGGVRLAHIDEHGALARAPLLLPGTDGSASSVAVACAPPSGPCRGVVAMLSGDALSLGAFGFTPGAAPPSAVKPIAALTGSSAQDVSPALSGEGATSLFFADDAVGGSGRVRWMTLEWP